MLEAPAGVMITGEKAETPTTASELTVKAAAATLAIIFFMLIISPPFFYYVCFCKT